MLKQSKVKTLGELRKALENYQKLVSATDDPTRVKKVAIHIEDYLSKPVIVEIAPRHKVQIVLERAARVRALTSEMKPYQAKKSIVDLRQGLKILLENLPGDPDTKPDFPWDDSD